MSESRIAAEGRAVHERYARRRQTYDPLESWVLLTRQELERALCRWARLAYPGGLGRVTLLAAWMWGWVLLGGGVVWHEFTVKKPANASVRGLLWRRVKSPHPSVCACPSPVVSPRTHRLCWLRKPAELTA